MTRKIGANAGKNAAKTGSDAKGFQYLGHAVMVAVGFADKVRQRPDLRHTVDHHSGYPGLLQHGAVVLTVAHRKGAFVGDVQPVGQCAQRLALVHTGGGHQSFEVVNEDLVRAETINELKVR